VIRGIGGEVLAFCTKKAVVTNLPFIRWKHIKALAQSYLRKDVLALSMAGIMH